MTKKNAATEPGGGTGTDMTQEKLNELYTAHQVHTLAQLIYQQIVARRSGGQPWTPSRGGGMSSPMNGQSSPSGWTGSAHGAPPPLMYWYP